MIPVISVIVPIYNAEKYLRECIDSVTAQAEFKQTELILIDDGSTDNSQFVCTGYSEQFQNIIYHRQQNGGVSAARNKGIELSRGEYIFFVDADDFLFNGIIEKILDSIKKSKPDMLIFDFVQEYSDFNEFIKYPFEPYKLSGRDFIGNDLADFMLSHSVMNSVWNKVMKKQIITENGIAFKKGMKYGEDRLFVLDFLKVCNNIFYIPENGYFYRYVPTGAINRERSDYFYTLLDDYNYTLDFYKNFSLDKEYVEKKYSKRLAQQMTGCIGLAFSTCSKKAFIKTLKSAFNDEKIRAVIEKLYKAGYFREGTEKFVSEKLLSCKPNAIYRYYNIKKIKTKIYSLLHRKEADLKKEKITPDSKK